MYPWLVPGLGGAKDFIRHEQNALVAQNETDWYLCLKRLLVDQGLRAQLATQGRALVEQTYCTEIQAEKLVQVMANSFN